MEGYKLYKLQNIENPIENRDHIVLAFVMEAGFTHT